ncbi:cell division control protein 48 [Phakopsora pachyrhizi]|uniref:Cell division control protein 48 n=1 Tax=Phakopsora pachyrhizi TaxID=170000 RepID=A0AAV0BUN4_PHAPC|nr:cell division control protein 48 [Phakopsora pachyrhizi]
MKIIASMLISASSKAFPKLLSLSPAIFLMILEPLIKKKKAPVLLDTALAIKFFPVPGGPNIRIPRVA